MSSSHHRLGLALAATLFTAVWIAPMSAAEMSSPPAKKTAAAAAPVRHVHHHRALEVAIVERVSGGGCRSCSFPIVVGVAF
ncbi:MAG: hypothetical protein JO303_16105 [Caulobacteraceae bacterium]|nr:hypothetical protein [Caulobacteraceae bacterium]